MSITNTKKTPAADELGGNRDEGLNPTPTKEQNMNHSTVPTRLDLDGWTTDIEPIEHGLIVKFTDNGRCAVGITMDPTEARRLASALLDGVAPDFGTADIEEIEEHAAVARRLQQRQDLSPAKYAAQLRKAGH